MRHRPVLVPCYFLFFPVPCLLFFPPLSCFFSQLFELLRGFFSGFEFFHLFLQESTRTDSRPSARACIDPGCPFFPWMSAIPMVSPACAQMPGPTGRRAARITARAHLAAAA